MNHFFTSLTWLFAPFSKFQKQWWIPALPVFCGLGYFVHLAAGAAVIPAEFTTFEISRNDRVAADFFEKPELDNLLPVSATTQAPLTPASEAMAWMEVLEGYDDEQLTAYDKALKYNNLAMAASLVSASSFQKNEQQKWSGRAIDFSRQAIVVLESQPLADRELRDEIHTRCLIAMALNFYQQGGVEKKDLTRQFRKVSENFLFRKGFCKHKIIKALATDGIIRLPGCGSEKFI